MNKILIADSGATKADWCVAEKGKILYQFKTKGLSPIFQSIEEISKEIKSEVLPHVENINISAVHFYGSGCTHEKIEDMTHAMKQSFVNADVEIYSDLVAVAHALCGNEKGIACILGTGSNSCEWDGNKIVNQVPPLGFILGDEGSGANLGKLLVGDILKNQLSKEMKDKFMKQFNLTYADIIDKVYRQPYPSRFLSGISPFVLQNINNQSIYRIAMRSFNDFFERNIMQYDINNNSVNFVGSIGWHYSEFIIEAASHKNIKVGKIEQSPMMGLIKYHSQQ